MNKFLIPRDSIPSVRTHAHMNMDLEQYINFFAGGTETFAHCINQLSCIRKKLFKRKDKKTKTKTKTTIDIESQTQVQPANTQPTETKSIQYSEPPNYEDVLAVLEKSDLKNKERMIRVLKFEHDYKPDDEDSYASYDKTELVGMMLAYTVALPFALVISVICATVLIASLTVGGCLLGLLTAGASFLGLNWDD